MKDIYYNQNKLPTLETIQFKTVINSDTGCWEWMGTRSCVDGIYYGTTWKHVRI